MKTRNYRKTQQEAFDRRDTEERAANPNDPWKVCTLKDAFREEEIQKELDCNYPRHGDTWGPWRFDAKRLVLQFIADNGAEWYEIDLEEMTSSAQMLDAIFQQAGKVWCKEPENLGHLIQALHDLLYPQQNLCSFGVNRNFDSSKYLKVGLKTRQLPTKPLMFRVVGPPTGCGEVNAARLLNSPAHSTPDRDVDGRRRSSISKAIP